MQHARCLCQIMTNVRSKVHAEESPKSQWPIVGTLQNTLVGCYITIYYKFIDKNMYHPLSLVSANGSSTELPFTIWFTPMV